MKGPFGSGWHMRPTSSRGLRKPDVTRECFLAPASSGLGRTLASHCSFESCPSGIDCGWGLWCPFASQFAQHVCGCQNVGPPKSRHVGPPKSRHVGPPKTKMWDAQKPKCGTPKMWDPPNVGPSKCGTPKTLAFLYVSSFFTMPTSGVLAEASASCRSWCGTRPSGPAAARSAGPTSAAS